MDKRTLSLLLTCGKLSFDELARLFSLPRIERPLRIPFSLDLITDDTDIWEWFRSTRENIYRLRILLKVPDVVRLENRSRFDGEEILCILLGRLCYPVRYTTMKLLFRRTKPELSMAFTWMLEHIDYNYGYLLTSLDLCWLRREDMSRFSRAIHEQGAPLRDIWAFIDGTFRPCCRPKRDQKTLYSGHYRLHGLKFQSVMAPNGSVVNLDGPWPGRRHESGMLAESGLLTALHTKMNNIGRTFRLYGDPAYPVAEYLEGPFRNGAQAVSQVEADFNEAMASVRIAVEWGFGEVVQQWAFVDYSKNLKVLWQPVGTFYSVATLLLNCRVCLGHGGKVSDFFGVAPPTIEQYLNNQL